MLITLTVSQFLLYIAYTLGFLWIFWGFYVLVMGLYRAHLQQRLQGFVQVLAFPFVLVGWVMDVLANVFIASIIFVELPKELLVTDRLQRYKTTSFGYKYNLSCFICENLLDVFDPSGDHC